MIKKLIIFFIAIAILFAESPLALSRGFSSNHNLLQKKPARFEPKPSVLPALQPPVSMRFFNAIPFTLEPLAAAAPSLIHVNGLTVTSPFRDTFVAFLSLQCIGTATRGREGTYYFSHISNFTVGGIVPPLGSFAVNDCAFETEFFFNISLFVAQGQKQQLWVYFLPTVQPGRGENLSFRVTNARGMDGGMYIGQLWDCRNINQCIGIPTSGPVITWQ